ncbi:MAG: response regulator transcription factor [Inconstantimicrobium porci]|uniref:response regulator transcription factor n=1 Tax=Inconstantimicrobium porci TaxID=2652291 RepID=UPI002A91EB7F|nr:response regulator transcription factor [Inconstantimicrobium porci]MDY5911032.1 response regulator transcription factor [Inconstantimicrobium porci]
MEKIIIVEDDNVIREELSGFLRRYNYEVSAPHSFENIIDFILSEKADLVLLDINLPIFDGYYICREVRKKSDVPIIVVTSRNSDMDELMSMNLGADDFVTKPYNTQILLARISAVLKRSKGSSQADNILKCSNFELNLLNAMLSYNGEEIELTKNEVKMLSCLIENKGTIVSRDSLMEYLWKSDYFVDDSTLSVNMTRLRKKLDSIGISGAIETRRGLGYIIS